MTPGQRLDAARALLNRPTPPVPGQLAVPTGPRIGSFCTGYGGLDAAVQQVFGGTTAWVSDIDPGAQKVIEHRMPGVPNIDDITAADWTGIARRHGSVDIVCGGYPCQPFSTAGKRKGTEDERHIWPYIADALRVLRPRVAIFENVAGHLRLGFDTVLADLAALGFDAEWCLVRASEVGAPHRRERLFILATATDAPRAGREGEGVRRQAAERGGPAADTADLGHERDRDARGRRDGPADHGQPPADASRLGRGEGRAEPARFQGRSDAVLGRRATAADADGGRLAGHPERDGRPNVGQPERASRLDPVGRGVQRTAPADTDPRGRGADEHGVRPGQPDADWGRFAPAVARWEHATGRPAPWATDDRHRLSPKFVEWLMGLPAGHVTAVPGLTRTQQLKALGNGVVPQQAEAALRYLADRARVPA